VRAVMTSRMRIIVRLFASQRETLGRGSLELDVPDGTTAAGAFARLTQSHGELTAPDGSLAFAVNQEHVAPDAALHDGDELALLPPVAGG
jgi:molybdopterin converting factor subunit 1